MTALKYFAELAPEYAICCAGSLLGVTLHQGTSFPVGKVDFITIQPLSFEEFLMQSLKVFCQKYEPEVAIRTSLKQFRIDGGILNLPLYEIWNLKGILETVFKQAAK